MLLLTTAIGAVNGKTSMPSAPKQHRAPNHGSARREYDQRRGSAQERGYTKQWGRESHAELQLIVADSGNPFCRYCKIANAEMMDHAIPPLRLHNRGTAEYDALFWDTRLWVPCGTPPTEDKPRGCICNTLKGNMLPHEIKTRLPWMYARLVAVLAERGLTVR